MCAQRFNALLRRLRGEGVAWDMAHMASSWHLLKGRELHMGAVRLGAALYGQQRIVPGTRPAARWLTRVVRIKKVRPALPSGRLACISGAGLRVVGRLRAGGHCPAH